MSVRVRSGLAGVVPVVVCVAMALLGVGASSAFAAGDANEAFCPQKTEASPGFREYLPDCRAYELVTPSLKDAFAFASGEPGGFLVSPGGSRVLMPSLGAVADTEDDEALNKGTFFGAIYGLVRGVAGWQVEPLDPSTVYVQEMGFERAKFEGASVDLTRTLWNLNSSYSVSGSSGPKTLDRLVVGTPGGVFEEVGPVLPSSFSEAGTVAFGVKGASADLGTVVTSVKRSSESGVENDLWPGDETVENGESLYMYTGVHNVQPELVGVNDVGGQISQCGTWLGSKESESTYDAVSDDGRAIFFTAAGVGQGPCGEGYTPSKSPPPVNELYVRVDGDRTVSVSEPPLSGSGVVPGRECTGVCATAEEDDPQPATFQGASAEPSGPNDVVKVFFTTTQPLLNEDVDATNDLYEAEVALGEPGSQFAHLKKLVMVSHGEDELGTTDGDGAEVLGVARVSADGSHVFYVAKGELTAVPNSEGRSAEAGRPNLYSFDTETRKTSFVATLIKSGEYPAKEAEALEPCKTIPAGTNRKACEKPIKAAFSTDEYNWQEEDERQAQTTPDGRYLLFTSVADLTSDDSSGIGVPELFEYDSEKGERGEKGSLVRVSVGQKGSYECPATGKIEQGYNCDGNTSVTADAPTISRVPASAPDGSSSPSFAASQATDREADRMLAENGDVFFESEDKLTELALEGTSTPSGDAFNVYEYDPIYGNVYMISDGKDDQMVKVGGVTEAGAVEKSYPATRLFGVSLSGDVFFQTADQLVPQDRDTQVNLYDARVEGGFPAPAVSGSCGAECQGSGSPPPLFISPTSAGYGGGVNVPPSSPSKATTQPKARVLTRARKLAKALKACHVKRNRRKRSACEAVAQKRYGKKAKKRYGKKAKKSSRGSK